MALGLAVVMTVASACSSSGESSGNDGSDASNDTFTLGTTALNISHFLPGNSGDSSITHAVWTSLTTLEPGTGELKNAIASSIKTTDQKHWTITIEPGWTFHNGEPITAQSFADSWNSTAYGPNAIRTNYLFDIFAGYEALNPAEGDPTAKMLSGVEVVDDSTLKVTLVEPQSQFPYVLSQTSFAPIPKQALEDLTKFDKMPIGNGPYKVEAPGITNNANQVTLTRYDDYAGTKGNAEKITVKAFQSRSTAYTAFQAGSIDLVLLDSGSDLKSAQAKYGDQLVKVTSPALVYFGFPLWEERFQDPKVRQAFSLAIDRETIIDSLLQGFAEKAGGIAPESMPGSAQDLCDYCDYDPAKAKQLLEEAGGWDGPLTVWTYNDPTMRPLLEAILNNLRTNLGISSIQLKSPATAQFYPSLAEHKVNGPFLLYLGATYPSLHQMLKQMFGAGSETNTTDYASDEFSAQLKQAASAPPDEAVELAQQGAETAMRELPLAPLYYPIVGLLYSENLGNVEPEYLGGPHLAGISVS